MVSTPASNLQHLARQIRIRSLQMVHRAKASHIGSCLSMTDMLAVLYGSVLQIRPQEPEWSGRDRFILSKGHGAAALYATLAECGFFPQEWLNDYCQDGGRLAGHVSSHGVPGVELSTGSLGHGLPVACGLALAARRAQAPYRIFVLMSDGELDEGSNWEALLFAAHHQLDNLVILVDYNQIQSFGRVAEVLNLEPLTAKLASFGASVCTVDGHDLQALTKALHTLPWESGKPNLLLCHTVKGKGVPWMEDDLAWHYRSPDSQQLQDALEALR